MDLVSTPACPSICQWSTMQWTAGLAMAYGTRVACRLTQCGGCSVPRQELSHSASKIYPAIHGVQPGWIPVTMNMPRHKTTRVKTDDSTVSAADQASDTDARRIPRSSQRVTRGKADSQIRLQIPRSPRSEVQRGRTVNGSMAVVTFARLLYMSARFRERSAAKRG